MNATPATLVRQINTAQRVNRRVTGDVLVYRTQSGDTSLVPRVQQEHEPHCFVCGRHTDHYAEHDDMVEAGTAYYTEDGDVWPTGQGPRHW